MSAPAAAQYGPPPGYGYDQPPPPPPPPGYGYGYGGGWHRPPPPPPAYGYGYGYAYRPGYHRVNYQHQVCRVHHGYYGRVYRNCWWAPDR